MLLSQLIFNLKNLRSGGLQSDDEDLSDRQYAFIIDAYWAMFVRQDQEKQLKIAPGYVSDLGKVDIITADPHECCAGLCTLRTSLKIPKTIQIKGRNHGFTFVGQYANAGTWHKEYQETTFQRASWDAKAKYTGDLPKWYLLNDYIYLVNAPLMLNHINIMMVPASPLEATKFRTCDCPGNNQDCITDFDVDYPFPAHMISSMTSAIQSNEFKLLIQVPKDTTNDSTDLT